MYAINDLRNSRLGWRLSRLAAMDRQEVLLRLRATWRDQFNQLQHAARPPKSYALNQVIGMRSQSEPNHNIESAPQHTAKPWLRQWPQKLARDDQLVRASLVQRGHFCLFKQNFELGVSPNWNQDPSTKIILDRSYGPLMKLRDPKKVGSIKHLWELNRHSWLLELSQAWTIDQDETLLASIEVYLGSWFEQCPSSSGPNWHSALEVALRLINWSIAWHQLGLNQHDSRARQLFAQPFLLQWEQSALQHAQFIEEHFSFGSSANNHLIGELAGLFIASQTWNRWPDSAHWAFLSKNKLSEQFLLQVLPDGVGAEQAFWYQYEVSDLLLFCVLLGEANQSFFPRQCLDRLNTSIEFLRSIHQNGGVPLIGDADDAHPIALGNPSALDPYATLIAAHDRYKNRANPLANDKIAWLIGDRKNMPPRGHSDDSQFKESSVWRSAGGYLVVHRKVDLQPVKLIADAAPLGFLSIAAHGHADALSIAMSYGGWPLLVDPGTFSYRPADPWRDWFRGTRAHNTVAIDGQDQSVIRGPFLWANHAQARLDQFESNAGLVWTAHHRGYERLSDPVLHRRVICWPLMSKVITIHDDFICEGEHQFEWTWQFHPIWNHLLKPHQLDLSHGDLKARINFPSGVVPQVLKGLDRCDGGWYSTGLGVKVPAPRLSCTKKFKGSWRATTTIALGEE